ncbi:MAG: glycosyltransferase family 4 protein, partial [Longimicrobiales bacterium]
ASRPSRRASRIHRWGLARVAAVGFTARAQADAFFTAHALPPDIRIVELLESSSDFMPGDLAAAREETGLDGDPCLLWLGHLDENKDPITVLDAFAAAAPMMPHARLWLAYLNAPLLDAVRARIALNPALCEGVRLIGAQPHERVETLLRATDFLVQASRFEGSGYAVIEALACGATPLVTDIPSFRRITGGGRVGGLFPPGDAAALARLLMKFAVRPRPTERAAARAHFEQSLSFVALGQELSAVYASLVEPRA